MTLDQKHSYHKKETQNTKILHNLIDQRNKTID